MWKISGYEHPGGGMSWTERGKINKWNPFFHRFDTATPDHRFSPPTPSACNHLGRGHVPWVVHVLLVLWVFFFFYKSFFFKFISRITQTDKMEKYSARKERSAMLFMRIKTLRCAPRAATARVGKHSVIFWGVFFSAACVRGRKVEDERGELVEEKGLALWGGKRGGEDETEVHFSPRLPYHLHW